MHFHALALCLLCRDLKVGKSHPREAIHGFVGLFGKDGRIVSAPSLCLSSCVIPDLLQSDHDQKEKIKRVLSLLLLPLRPIMVAILLNLSTLLLTHHSRRLQRLQWTVGDSQSGFPKEKQATLLTTGWRKMRK